MFDFIAIPQEKCILLNTEWEHCLAHVLSTEDTKVIEFTCKELWKYDMI